MNILLISEVYLPTVSGVASSTDSIARFLVSQGHTVYLICPKPFAKEPDIPAGLHIIHTPSIPDPFFVGKPMTLSLFGILPIWQTIQRHKIDIAHIQEPGNLGVVGLLLCKIHRIPVLGALHFSLEQVRLLFPTPLRPIANPITKLYIKLLYPHYQTIMVPTQTVVSSVQSLIGTSVPIHAVSNGVDTNYFTASANKESLRKKYNFPTSQPLFLYVGRLDKDKNMETILQALTHVKKPMHFLLAGVGKYENHLRQLAKTLGVDHKITWIGAVSRDTMLETYQASDCFVIMSPVETQSIVALQAIACGLPVIAADAGALPELVHDGENGYTIPTYDAATLAHKIDSLSQNPQLRSIMGQKSRTISLTHHKPKALSKLLVLYRSLL